ncbi:MAG: hypothetical protein QME64_04250 [bacterium]|nr:hypothetical protein [bacterium]
MFLIGSTARGEFSYRIEPDGELTFWSDFELLVVAETKPTETDRSKLLTQLGELERQWDKNSPLFHIDCSYISRNQFRNLPLLIRHYEASQVGKVIFGTDIRSEMPKINCANLDYRELAEVILWRLWALALYAPKEWLVDKERIGESENPECFRGETTKSLFSFVLCRNALDLTTYLLPWEKVLLPSFKERTEYITAHYAELRLREFFDSSFPEFLNTCLRGKFEFKFPESTEQLYQRTLAYFVQAGKHLLLVNDLKDNVREFTTSILNYQSRLFNEYRFRRKIYELYLIKKFRSEKSFPGWFRWYLQGKISKMVVCLYHLHFALQAIAVTGEMAEAENQLNAASKLLAQVSLCRLPAECYDSSISVGVRWLLIRKMVARFLMDLYQSVGVKEDYINRILNNESD